jgi:hypothetical protein
LYLLRSVSNVDALTFTALHQQPCNPISHANASPHAGHSCGRLITGRTFVSKLDQFIAETIPLTRASEASVAPFFRAHLSPRNLYLGPNQNPRDYVSDPRHRHNLQLHHSQTARK